MGDDSERRLRTDMRMKVTRRVPPIERAPLDGDILHRVGRALLLWTVAATVFWTVFNVDFGLTGGARLLLVVVFFFTGIYTGVAGAVALVTGAPLSAPRV